MGRIGKSRQRRRDRTEGAASSPGRTWAGRSGLVALGLCAGLAAGPAVWGDDDSNPGGIVDGHESAPVVASGIARPSRNEPQAAQTASSQGGLLESWLEMAEAERLASLARKATGAGLDLVARGVIDRLEEDSLKSLITSTTDFSSAELGEIEDVPGFAMDLARIAMEGTVREAAAPEEDVLPIDFSSQITWDHRASFAQSQFSSDEERIYAVFESGDLGLSNTLAKWTRVDDGEILLFERHRIREAADSSFVYLDAPPGGWLPGEYRVDFYSADTELRWLASGQHRITL